MTYDDHVRSDELAQRPTRHPQSATQLRYRCQRGGSPWRYDGDACTRAEAAMIRYSARSVNSRIAAYVALHAWQMLLPRRNFHMCRRPPTVQGPWSVRGRNTAKTAFYA